ncbi:MAG: DUF4412 domain-containing protein [Bacteroidota bacterium]
MKNLCFLLLSVFAFTVVSAQPFEGVIAFSIKGPDESKTLQYLTKGEMVRIEFEQMPGMAMAVVVNSKTGSSFVLMTESKMFMEMNLKDMSAPEASKKDIDFQKTGKTRNIAGYSCEQILMKQDGAEVEMWVTKGLGTFVSNFNAGAESPAMKKIEKELTSKGYFPLLMISKSPGQGESRMEAISVTRKQLARNLFAVPDGFTKMQMPPRQ